MLNLNIYLTYIYIVYILIQNIPNLYIYIYGILTTDNKQAKV